MHVKNWKHLVPAVKVLTVQGNSIMVTRCLNKWFEKALWRWGEIIFTANKHDNDFSYLQEVRWRIINVTFDAHHEKTVFVVVIAKEGWARMAASILLLVWHRLFRIWLCWHHLIQYNRLEPLERGKALVDYILEKSVSCQKIIFSKSRCHAKRMDVATRAHPSFGMTTTKTLMSVFSWRESSECVVMQA